MSEKKKRGPVTLKVKTLATAEGLALLKILEGIMQDGVIADEEIRDLKAWLDDHPLLDFPGAAFLREEIAGILEDGLITKQERKVLQDAILRVLPLDSRETAKEAVAQAKKVLAAQPQPSKVKHDWTQDPATEKQIAFIRSLGGQCSSNITKGEAGELIAELRDRKSQGRRYPTVRQQMVLCFWNKLEMMESSVQDVSDWMTEWYDEDPRRLMAWELWKLENGDDGGHDPVRIENVRVGIGYDYLQKVSDKEARLRDRGVIVGSQQVTIEISAEDIIRKLRVITQEPVEQEEPEEPEAKITWKSVVWAIIIMAVLAAMFWAIATGVGRMQ